MEIRLGYLTQKLNQDVKELFEFETGIDSEAAPPLSTFEIADKQDFIRSACLLKRYGAAVIVMAFDEEGQAVTTARKVAICERAHRILTDEVGTPPGGHHFRCQCAHRRHRH
jgi:hypothetical protein